MVVTKTARRYAGALLSLAAETKQLDKVLVDVQDIKKTVEDSRELLLFLRSPIISRERKSAGLKALFAASTTKLTAEFLTQLTKRGREGELPAICAAFLEQCDAFKGIERVTVRSAMPLDKASEKNLLTALSKLTGKEVVMSITVDPTLMGGLQVQIGDTIHDGTVLSSLRKIALAFENKLA